MDEGRRTDIRDGEDVKRQCCQTNLGSPNEMLQLYQIDLTEIVQKLEDKVMNLYLTKQGPAQHLGDSSFPPAKLEPLTRNHF